MRKNKTILIGLLAITLVGTWITGCKKEEDNSNSNTNCKPTKYIFSSGGGASTSGFWTYDNQGRVTKDSIPSDPNASSLFNYVGNSVNASDGYFHNVNIQLNGSGFPIESHGYLQFNATYNTDGTLQKIRGEYSSSETYILDNVVYTAGNITSYRITDSTSSGNTSYTYTCTYETSKEYVPYNPVLKIYALWGEFDWFHPDPFTKFTPQPFSKNILKQITYSFGGDKTFTYQYDSRNNITNLKDGWYDIFYEYTCQ